jgi:hypothetical protein
MRDIGDERVGGVVLVNGVALPKNEIILDMTDCMIRDEGVPQTE